MARKIEDVTTEEQLVDAVAAMADPEKYTWNTQGKQDTRERAKKIVSFIRLFDGRDKQP